MADERSPRHGLEEGDGGPAHATGQGHATLRWPAHDLRRVRLDPRRVSRLAVLGQGPSRSRPGRRRSESWLVGFRTDKRRSTPHFTRAAENRETEECRMRGFPIVPRVLGVALLAALTMGG